jgi:hypothetical protein
MYVPQSFEAAGHQGHFGTRQKDCFLIAFEACRKPKSRLLEQQSAALSEV